MVSHSLTLIHTDKQAGPTALGLKGSDTWIHKDSQGHTGTRKDSQELTGTHKDSQGLTGTHMVSDSLTLIHTDKQAGPTKPGVKGSDTRFHNDSRGLTGTHKHS